MESINRPLVEQLIQFKNKKRYSLHVPGHKDGMLSELPDEARSALAYDWTELDGLDDLHEATEVIQTAQEMLAKLYDADKSFFLINGSTVGNLAMIYAVCKKDDIVVVQRNAHKSIFNAIELTGAKAVFINPNWDHHSMAAGAVTALQVKLALDSYPQAKGVILTYPTYYGVTGNALEEIIRLCHERQVPVLVDEAHGAHFVIGDPFPRSALSMGADVVVHSAHKTLPAMTMASYLHVRSNLISSEEIARYLKMLQSSSPSYLLMASLDDARAYAESYKDEDSVKLMDTRALFIEELVQHPRIRVIETEDPLKLMLRVEGCSGFEVQKSLDKIGVYVELADPHQVLLVLPLLKLKHIYPFREIVKRIHGVVDEIHVVPCETFVERPQKYAKNISLPAYTASEIVELKVGWQAYEECLGKIAGATITPYPPGIPLLLIGERITKSHIETLRNLITLKARFHGDIKLAEGQIKVVLNEMRE